MPTVRFPAAGDSVPGYLAIPAAGAGPGTVVLQEWWGCDAHICSVCDRLAAQGFLALAPDLYHGERPGGPDEAERTMMALSMPQVVDEMAGAVAYLQGQTGGTGVGALGFCLGGGLSLWAAATNPGVAATVVYYSVLPHGEPDYSAITGPVMGHFGAADPWVPATQVAALEQALAAAGVEARFYRYEGADHAFFNDTRPGGAYHAQAASLSWQRSTAFLHRALS
ncbi:MAG TPA: alpha/beta fold hydrolase [Actinomycetota bacterium]|nr:alpha/beta fold hydrolase [Actinomycetota bacterium]